MYRTDVQKRQGGGYGLVEVIIGVAIFMLCLTGLIAAYTVFVRVGVKTLTTIQASYLLEEGVEAVTLMRDNGFTTYIAGLTVGTNYYLYWNGTTWTSTTTPALVDSLYTRTFSLAAVNRDASDNIASSGTNDTGTRKLTVSVAWKTGASTTTRSLSTYITNLFSN